MCSDFIRVRIRLNLVFTCCCVKEVVRSIDIVESIFYTYIDVYFCRYFKKKKKQNRENLDMHVIYIIALCCN